MTHVHLATRVHLDPSFGAGGFATPQPVVVDGLQFPDVGLVRAPGGTLVAGATGLIGETEHFYLVACNPDGGLDPTFGRNGETVSSIPARGSALALQPAPKLPDGREREGALILIGGQTTDPDTGTNVIAVQRYTLAGRLDTRFGTGGTVLDEVAAAPGPAGTDDESAWALAVQPGVGILAAGYLLKPDGSRGIIVRWHFDGRLDTTFNRLSGAAGSGRLIYPAPDAAGDLWGNVTDTAFTCLAMQENGRIVVGGTYGAQFLVARLMPDGSFDPSFGQGGRVLLTLGLGWAGAPTLLVQPDGRIVLMASVDEDGETGIGVARLLPNGDLDRTFGRLIPSSYGPPANRLGGQVTHRLGWNIQDVPGARSAGVNDAVLQPGAHPGLIGVGGTQITSAFDGDLLVTRLLGDGDVDTLSTGPAGAVESPVPDGGGRATAAVYDAELHAVTVAGGASSHGRTGIALARYVLPG